MGRTRVHFKTWRPSCPVARLRLVLVKGDLQLSIGAGSAHDFAMSNRAPLHAFEIVFYSTASVLAAVGLTWYFLH